MTDKYVEKSKIFAQMRLYGFRAPDMTVTEFVDDLPAADVEKVRHGEWVENPIMSDSYSKSYYCNLCKRSVRIPNGCHLQNLAPYCRCGAKMSGKDEEAEYEQV